MHRKPWQYAVLVHDELWQHDRFRLCRCHESMASDTPALGTFWSSRPRKPQPAVKMCKNTYSMCR